MSLTVSPSRSVRRGSAYLQLGPVKSGLIAIVTLLLIATSTEPALTFASLLTLVLGIKLLWRPAEPPILFAAFFIQWLQASMAIYRASLNDVQLDFLYPGYFGVGHGIATATWLSLFGLLVLAGGIRLALLGVAPNVRTAFILEIRQFSLKKVFRAYWISQLVTLGLEAVGSVLSSGLTQALIVINNFRWIFFFVLAVTVLVQRRGYRLLAFVCVFEVARGFMSYFAEYKDVFLVLGIAYLTARPQLNTRTLAVAALIIGSLVVFAAAWSSVKSDYRDFINLGTGRQTILVGPTEQLTRIGELMLEGMTQLSIGFDNLTRRIEYIYFFGRVVDRVPSVAPHDNGALWSNAIIHILTPRLLFPDKPMLDADVFNTQRYTGLELTKQGGLQTEIPMGYMTETYIDFGSPLMFVPIFLLGLLYGVQYRYIITRRQYVIFAFGAAAVLMMPMAKFEASIVKTLGGSLTTFGVVIITFSMFAPKLWRLLQVPARKRTPPAGFATGTSF
jgi:hypothetical protein